MESMNSISYIMDVGRKIDSREESLAKLVSKGKCKLFARPLTSSKAPRDPTDLFTIVVKNGLDLSRYLVYVGDSLSEGTIGNGKKTSTSKDEVCFTEPTELIVYFHYTIARLKKETPQGLEVSISFMKGKKVQTIEIGSDLHKFGVTFSSLLEELGL